MHLKSKVILVVSSIFFLLWDLPLACASHAQETASEQFDELAHEYEHSLFAYSPELALFWGKTNVSLDRFTDFSLEGYAAWLLQEDAFLTRIDALDERELQDTPSYITYLLLKETLEAKKASRICREELWDINPTFGWHNKLAMVAEQQPVGTARYRRLALARWRTFNEVVDKQIMNLRRGQALGYTAPKPAVNRVIAQLTISLEAPIEDSPYFAFARRDDNKRFKKDVAHLIKTLINPSLKKYRDYLQTDYLPLARQEIGVMANPAGYECYLAKLKQETTLDLTPTEIHTQGLKALQSIEKEVAEIGFKKYGTRDMASIFEQAKEESRHYFMTEDDILAYNLSALAKVSAKLSLWFEIVPTSKGKIQAYPLHRAKTGAPGEYHPPSEDGTRAGVFYINTYKPQEKSRIDQEATLFHELIPGHHFQAALMYENTKIPTLNRYLFNAGFCEGWALYAERLADEMALYQDDISRLGMLSNESLRAARLVVDTGIHAFHWSREDALAYLKQHTALQDAIIEGEVDRYIMMPGQATAYLIGKNEIQMLRERAQKQLGERFDIRQFHHQVLKNGLLTLPLLRAQMDAWLRQETTRMGG